MNAILQLIHIAGRYCSSSLCHPCLASLWLKSKLDRLSYSAWYLSHMKD